MLEKRAEGPEPFAVRLPSNLVEAPNNPIARHEEPMKRNRNGARKQEKAIRLWTLDEARRALPYVTAVMRSLRDHRLEWAAHDRKSGQLADRPGRPDRNSLIAQEETARLAQQARERYEGASQELQDLDVFPLDPIQGHAVIPFMHQEQLAWFIVDLFADPPMQSWRFHDDDPDLRRPIVEVPSGPGTNVWVA